MLGQGQGDPPARLGGVGHQLHKHLADQALVHQRPHPVGNPHGQLHADHSQQPPHPLSQGAAELRQIGEAVLQRGRGFAAQPGRQLQPPHDAQHTADALIHRRQIALLIYSRPLQHLGGGRHLGQLAAQLLCGPGRALADVCVCFAHVPAPFHPYDYVMQDSAGFSWEWLPPALSNHVAICRIFPIVADPSPFGKAGQGK